MVVEKRGLAVSKWVIWTKAPHIPQRGWVEKSNPSIMCNAPHGFSSMRKRPLCKMAKDSPRDTIKPDPNVAASHQGLLTAKTRVSKNTTSPFKRFWLRSCWNNCNSVIMTANAIMMEESSGRRLKR